MPWPIDTMLSRRSLLVSAGLASGAIALGFRFGPWGHAAPPQDAEIDNWVIVAPDNTVTLRIAQMELGQGAITTMAQLLAEELEVSWSQIRTEFISIRRHLQADKVYGRTETSAGVGARMSELPLRIAGAQIRSMLLQAAAGDWGVPIGDLVARDGVVTHHPTSRALTYGQLAPSASRLSPPDPKTLRLKDPADWKFIGQSQPRLDIPGKVKGSAAFGVDTRLPGMQHASIAMCPVFGGKLASCDADTALALPGVTKVVAFKDSRPSPGDAANAVAVVASNWWQAETALRAMTLTWEGGSTADDASILANLRTGLGGPADTVLRDDGAVDAALQAAGRIVEAEYFVPFLDQAPLEPMNFTALVTEDRFEVWGPVQHPEDAILAAAQAAGMPVDKGGLNVTLQGGSYGRRIATDFVVQAVLIAKAMKGVPVNLMWSREETTTHSFYRQASLARLQGALDSDGGLALWTHRIVAQSRDSAHTNLGADTILYASPNMRVGLSLRASDVPEGSMRGVGYSINCFAVQSFLDELAREAGTDAYAFQRKLLDPAKTSPNAPRAEFDADISPSERAGRLRAVLDEAARMAQWGVALGPDRGRGIAALEQSGAFYAAVVEVTLDNKGWFTIDRVVVAGDPGQLVNPENASSQVQGCVAFGLTSALYGEIRIDRGQATEKNLFDYRILRADEMPPVDIHWILGRPFWGDVSQSALNLMAPAVANAIFDAGGPRIRSLPIKNHKIVKRVA